MEQLKLPGTCCNQWSLIASSQAQLSLINSIIWQEEEQDGLMKQFLELKNGLVNIEDLRDIEPSVFLAPFLEVIRSEETTGQITSLALSALNKFLAYGLIGEYHVQYTALFDC